MALAVLLMNSANTAAMLRVVRFSFIVFVSFLFVGCFVDAFRRVQVIARRVPRISCRLVFAEVSNIQVPAKQHGYRVPIRSDFFVACSDFALAVLERAEASPDFTPRHVSRLIENAVENFARWPSQIRASSAP